MSGCWEILSYIVPCAFLLTSPLRDFDQTSPTILFFYNIISSTYIKIWNHIYFMHTLNEHIDNWCMMEPSIVHDVGLPWHLHEHPVGKWVDYDQDSVMVRRYIYRDLWGIPESIIWKDLPKSGYMDLFSFAWECTCGMARDSKKWKTNRRWLWRCVIGSRGGSVWSCLKFSRFDHYGHSIFLRRLGGLGCD